MKIKLTAILTGILMFPGAVTAEMDYERDIAESLVNSVTASEAVWLQANGNQVLGLYLPAEEENSSSAAIILHSIAAHPDWPEIISPLRKGLAAADWSTLSIQMPVLPAFEPLANYGATLNDASRRIQSAIRWLTDAGKKNIVIVGYSFGATQAIDFLQQSGSGVVAFVGVSMQSQPFLKPGYDLLAGLEKLTLPVLDIYGSRDYTEVLRSVDDRRLAGKQDGEDNYTQIMLDGADHYFSGLDAVLVKRIRSWLGKTLPEKMEANKSTENQKTRKPST